METQNTGKKGYMFIKLDLEKAYDIFPERLFETP